MNYIFFHYLFASSLSLSSLLPTPIPFPLSSLHNPSLYPSPLPSHLPPPDSKEKELGTNTSLLTTLKFSYIAALSIHAIACCWFAISCKNQAVFNEDSSESLCKTDSWVAGLEGEESSYLME